MLLKGKRIFILEDNLANRLIMQTILEREGATIFFERWGKNTLEEIHKAEPIDIILMDLMLPHGASGYDVYETIRADPKYANALIVAVSASDPATAVKKTKEYGFNGFIYKPVDFREFAHQIASILSGEGVWQVR